MSYAPANAKEAERPLGRLWLVSAVGWAAIAAAYIELRRLHDGPELDGLHEVFA